MPTFIQPILTAIKGASLTAKIIGVTAAVIVVGGTTAVIIAQTNSSTQESQDVETNDNPDKNAEQEELENKEEIKTQDEGSDKQENETSEPSKNDTQTSNSGITKPSNPSSSNQSGNSSQQGTSQSTTQTQPATPKAEFNLNDSIQVMRYGYTCSKFLGGDSYDPSNYVSAPGGAWIDIEATGQRFTYGNGYPMACPDGYELNGGGYPEVLDETECNLFNLSCDRW